MELLDWISNGLSERTNSDEISDLVRGYFFQERGESNPIDSSKRPSLPYFSGSRFDDFAPSGIRSATSFTVDDVLAIELLSVQLKPVGILEMLADGPKKDSLNAKLKALKEADLGSLHQQKEPLSEHYAVRDLYRELRQVYSVGSVKATKLMSRKFPHLVPIYDSRIHTGIRASGKYPTDDSVFAYWDRVQEFLSFERDGGRLDVIRQVELATHYPDVSVLRVLDVALWLKASGYTYDYNNRRVQVQLRK